MRSGLGAECSPEHSASRPGTHHVRSGGVRDKDFIEAIDGTSDVVLSDGDLVTEGGFEAFEEMEDFLTDDGFEV